MKKYSRNYFSCVTLLYSVFAAYFIFILLVTSLHAHWKKKKDLQDFSLDLGKTKTTITIISLQEGFLGPRWGRLATIITGILTKCSQLYCSWDFNHFCVYGRFGSLFRCPPFFINEFTTSVCLLSFNKTKPDISCKSGGDLADRTSITIYE